MSENFSPAHYPHPAGTALPFGEAVPTSCPATVAAGPAVERWRRAAQASPGLAGYDQDWSSRHLRLQVSRYRASHDLVTFTSHSTVRGVLPRTVAGPVWVAGPPAGAQAVDPIWTALAGLAALIEDQEARKPADRSLGMRVWNVGVSFTENGPEIVFKCLQS
jgi:hypothetical protein